MFQLSLSKLRVSSSSAVFLWQPTKSSNCNRLTSPFVAARAGDGRVPYSTTRKCDRFYVSNHSFQVSTTRKKTENAEAINHQSSQHTTIIMRITSVLSLPSVVLVRNQPRTRNKKNIVSLIVIIQRCWDTVLTTRSFVFSCFCDWHAMTRQSCG